MFNELGKLLSPKFKQELLDMFTEKHTFSKTRNIGKASVSLRFRVMAGVRTESNILNPNQYPEIKHDTLNFIVPCHNDKDKKEHIRKLKIAFKEVANQQAFSQFKPFVIRHHLNGKFLVFQIPI